MTLTQRIATVKPFRLRMNCGHIEIRMMREETAQCIFSPGIVIDVPTSACCECEPSKATMRESQRAINAQHGL